MKPILLEMQAFGPYGGKLPPIDFERFGDGIYLITGDTGAGKTVIFDAIMFALFEEVSARPAGGSNSGVDKASVRDKSMLHSDYAEPGTDTVVKLIFEENRKRYTVRRTIHYPRKQSADGPVVPQYRAELTGEDCRPAEGSQKVTAAVEEILKMNSVQFRQIVMLAQGEFDAFISAKDDERKNILKRIFENQSYTQFQETLAKAENLLNERIGALNAEIARALAPDVFWLPEDTPEEKRKEFDPDHPELTEHINALIREDLQQTERLQGQQDTLTRTAEELNRKLGAAKADNQSLDELAEKRRYELQLTGQKQAMETMKAETDRTADAFRQILPKEREAEQAENRLTREKQELETANGMLTALNGRREAAAAEAGKNGERLEEIRRLEIKAAQIRDHLQDIESLAANAETLRKTGEAHQTAVLQARNSGIREQQTAELLAKTESELLELKNAGVELNNARHEKEKCDTLMKRIRGTGGLSDQIRDLAEAEERFRVRSGRLEQLLRAKSEAAGHYDTLYGNYIRGYAGILAEEMKKTIERDGSGTCPVCGSCFHRADTHEGFAVRPEVTPDRDELDRAEAEKRRTEEAFSAADTEWNRIAANVEERTGTVCAAADELFPGAAPWTRERIGTEELEEYTENAAREAEEAGRKVEEAERKVSTCNALLEQQTRLQQERDAAHAETAELEKQALSLEKDMQHCTTENERLKRNVVQNGMEEYTSRAAAEEAADRTEKQAALLRTECENADTALQDAEKEIAACSGRIGQLKEEIRKTGTELEEKKQAMRKAVTEFGFDSEDAYRTAVARIGTADGEQWITARNQRYNTYLSELAATRERVLELEKKTEGMVYTDLQALNEALAANAASAAEVRGLLLEHGIHAAGHVKARDQITASYRQDGKLRRAREKIGHLSSVANGTAGTGGKHTFDGYVYGRAFGEILDRAGAYLQEMSGGHYRLMHDREGLAVRKTARADFKVMVEDRITHSNREIGSTSGGEKFQIAMSLALGLSDVVQAHTSTVKIDAMFIDEGFGTLDMNSLHQMLNVLKNLSGGHRQIGIISHVDKLEEIIENKYIRVRKDPRQGSTLKQEC